MKKKALIFCLVVFCLFTVAGCSLPFAKDSANPLDLEKANRYEILIGLNDVTTGKQIMETDKAIETVKKIILDYVNGVTITTSVGHYYVGALIIDETSLSCVIYGGDDEAIAALANQLTSELNVSVLVAKSTSAYRLMTPANSLEFN